MPVNHTAPDRPCSGGRSLSRHGRRAHRGYSLIEVMVATFLLSMAVLTFAALFPVAAKSSKMTGNYAQAVSIAQHKIDQLRAIGYGRLNYTEMLNAGIIDAAPGSDPYEFDVIDNLAGYFPIYTGTISLATEAADLTRVTVTVAWQGQGDRATQGNATLVALIPAE
jgi:prepilin-type N-terminal cleavage/methylation domain-containing protein